MRTKSTENTFVVRTIQIDPFNMSKVEDISSRLTLRSGTKVCDLSSGFFLLVSRVLNHQPAPSLILTTQPKHSTNSNRSLTHAHPPRRHLGMYSGLAESPPPPRSITPSPSVTEPSTPPNNTTTNPSSVPPSPPTLPPNPISNPYPAPNSSSSQKSINRARPYKRHTRRSKRVLRRLVWGGMWIYVWSIIRIMGWRGGGLSGRLWRGRRRRVW